MSRPGYRGGFNPFRRGGKFATPTSADTSSDAGAGAAAASLGVTNRAIGASSEQVNADIRAAAGRGVGGNAYGGPIPQEAATRGYNRTQQGQPAQLYRNKQDAAAARPAPLAEGAGLSASEHAAARELVNTYSRGRLTEGSTPGEVLKALRHTVATQAPMISHDEAQHADTLIEKLTTPPRTGGLITNRVLNHIDRLPQDDGARLTPATRAALQPLLPHMEGAGFAEFGINGAAINILQQGQGSITPAHKALLLKAYAEHGIDPPAGATRSDLLAAMDSVTEAKPYTPAYNNRIGYGVAMALKANRPEVAMTLADTPDGAGIGWTITREDLGAPHQE